MDASSFLRELTLAIAARGPVNPIGALGSPGAVNTEASTVLPHGLAGRLDRNQDREGGRALDPSTALVKTGPSALDIPGGFAERARPACDA